MLFRSEEEQYTGLNDSKRTPEFPEGQEIYEGDIVVKDGKRYVIRYSIHSFDLACSTDDWPKRKDGYSYLATSWSDIKVIGNIHDNPELLESE